MLIDSHCHINDPIYINKAAQYVEEAKQAGVVFMLVVGYDLQSSISAVKIAEQFEGVYAAVGIIPEEIKKMKPTDLREIEKLLSNKKVIAIGEIGLDYFWDKDEKLKYSQREYFIKQIKLANKYNLPVSIHCRDAYEDCFKILQNYPVKRLGIIHCFSSSPEMAKMFAKLGYLLGIGGICTFKNAIKSKEVVKMISLDRLVLETDAPYLAPEPHRGEANHSKFIGLVRDEVARLKNIDPKNVEQTTSDNFSKLFKL